MKKKSSFSTKGGRADIGDLIIDRIMPNRYADAVGPFVFLDHIVPNKPSAINTAGTGAHPHRGIATLTYLLDGEAEHFDSAGNYAMVHSGGVQWMNAGNGIVHDETINADSKTGSGLVHGFQFWINLPAAIKAGRPAYRSIQASEVPFTSLPDGSGWIRVIAGSFEELSSPLPSYSKQFLYHIHLEPGRTFNTNFKANTELAAYLPLQSVTINDETFDQGDFIEYDRKEGEFEIINTNGEACDVIIFGGEAYTEPIVAEGPFVMNTPQEIGEAYKDYYGGKYGEIRYSGREGL